MVDTGATPRKSWRRSTWALAIGTFLALLVIWLTWLRPGDMPAAAGRGRGRLDRAGPTDIRPQPAQPAGHKNGSHGVHRHRGRPVRVVSSEGRARRLELRLRAL